MFITNYHTLFYFWLKEHLVKHQKVSKYYNHDCRNQVLVKVYGFLLFDKNMGKNLSGKYGLNLFDRAKRSAIDALKTTSKRVI